MDDDNYKWSSLREETIGEYPIFKLKKVKRRSACGKEGDFYTLDSHDWVTIVPKIFIDNRPYFVIVEQFRHGSETLTFEFPAGAVEPKEPPIETAYRELLEETGCKANKLTAIGKTNPNPAFMSNTTHTFLAEEIERGFEQNLDEHEILKYHTILEEEVHRKIGEPPYNSAIMVQAYFWYLKSSKKI